MSIFFAWVNPNEIDFNPSVHARNDENAYSFTITHEEGQMPLADVVIKNPGVGLLNPSRKQWAWLSTNATGTITPLFFGRIIGIPTDLLGYQITIQFISKSLDYIAQKQSLADTLRVAPYYDPIFLSDEALIDPDATLEFYPGAAFHVDRIPNNGRKAMDWTTSDILVGEDGELTYGESDILFGSLSIDLKQSPLRAVRVDAKVHWSQNFRGQVIPIYSGWVKTLTGDSLAEQWPKGGVDLGGGWIADWRSTAVALGGTGGVYQESGSWQDQNQEHNEGDTISASWSVSIPMVQGIEINRRESATFGAIGGAYSFLGTNGSSTTNSTVSDAGLFGSGSSGGGNPTSGYSVSYNVLAIWRVFCQLYIRPSNKPNAFTETFTFTLTSDIQHLLYEPDAQEETEVITLESQDVGEAVYSFKAWTSLRGQYVQLGQIMLPNMRTVGPGGTSFQICVAAGVVGTNEILYSDTIGAITQHGGAQFACIGTSLPTIEDWAPNTYYKAGAIICTEENGGWFYVCNQEGTTGGVFPFPNGVPSAPNYYFNIPINTYFPPSFGQNFADYQVIWTSLAHGGPSLATPIGGQPGNVTQNAFFSQHRGQLAISAAIMKAVAKMRTRARAIEISATVDLKLALGLSCRKNATFVSDFIPGGIATGKIVKYTLRGNGDTGEFLADITIGCAIGKAGVPYTSVEGTPLYVQTGYVQSGYQATTGQVVSHGYVAFTPPLPPATPNGLTTNGFTSPLTYNQVVLSAGWFGSLAEQTRLARIAYGSSPSSTIGANGAVKRADWLQKRIDAAQEKLNSEAGSVFFQLKLKPIGGLSSATPYVVNVSPLLIPKQIDLGA